MTQNLIDRRDFLKTAGIGALGTLGTGMLPEKTLSAIRSIEPMKITKIEALRIRPDLVVEGKRIVWIWIRLHTDKGIVGIGETYPFTEGQIGALKDYAPRILGQDPRNIEEIWRNIYFNMTMRGAGGADMRILSAINIAQWDILGKALEAPIYSLLGGKSQEKLRVYNTYLDDWSPINNWKMDKDLDKIVKFLLDRGIKGIKIYPFMVGDGNYISPADLDKELRWLRGIRDIAGNEMDIVLDIWGHWNLPSAMKICKACEPFNPLYVEDIMLMSNAQSYAALARETSVPICMSETMATRFEYREYFESKALDVVMFDLVWCGGISEAKKIADMADTYFIPIVPHTGGGPVLWLSSIHVATASTNFAIMESVHHFYTYQWPYFMKNLPVPVDGYVTPPEEPGLGVEFREEPFKNGDIIVETIAEL
ncbi:mandelate racemase/muconate lactonizing enzyme family protein [Candidatus Latescibacterota bacterium]